MIYSFIQVTSYNGEKKKYKIQFFDVGHNLMKVPENKVQGFASDDELIENVPEKYRENWKKGMEIAIKAQESGFDESGLSEASFTST